MAWLVTGGAGYIGSHVVQSFREAGIPVVVIDDLSSGFDAFIPADVPHYAGSVLDRGLLDTIFAEHPVAGVVHLAGFKYAGVSVQRPLHTYQQNVTATAVLLEAMEAAGVANIVFSSSAAVFGTPAVDLVTEQTATRPESPYGESKLIGEWLIADQARAQGIGHTSLRYFNVVGSGQPGLYDTSPHNLFPLIFQALIEGRTPTVFGTDYATRDGSCERDYVHVSDIALAHVEAARALEAGLPLEAVYNLGSGSGVTVLEIMAAVAEVTGIDFAPERAPRRPGDPDRIVASGELARRDLQWQMRHSLTEMVSSAWQARRHA